MDKRTQQANDEMAMNKIRIRNLIKDQERNKPIWNAKQKELYSNSLDIGNPTSLTQIISDEVSDEINNIGNPLNKDTALQNLLKITHNPIDAQYILEHLSDGGLLYLNYNFNKIVTDIQKYHKKMNRLVFINYIETENDKNPISLLPPKLNDIGMQNQANTQMLNQQASIKANKELSQNNIVVNQQAKEEFKSNRESIKEHQLINKDNLKRISKKQFRLEPVEDDDENIHNLLNEKLVYMPPELNLEVEAELQKNKGRLLLNEKQDKQLLNERDAPDVKINPIDNNVNRTEDENVGKRRALYKLNKNVYDNMDKKLNNAVSNHHAKNTAKSRALQKFKENAIEHKRLRKAAYAVGQKTINKYQKAAFDTMKHQKAINDNKKTITEEPTTEQHLRESEIPKERDASQREADKNKVEEEYRFLYSHYKKPELIKEAQEENVKINRHKTKAEIINELVKHHLKIQGFGMSYGKGADIQQQAKDKNYVYIGKFYVDGDKLNEKNQLVVKYTKNDGHSHRIKPCIVNNDTKEVLHDILINKFDIRLYNKLAELDQRIIKRFVQTLKIDVPIPAEEMDKKFQKEFDLYLGEYRAGNDSTELKSKLKKYVVEAINENIIPRHQGMLLIYELSI